MSTSGDIKSGQVCAEGETVNGDIVRSWEMSQYGLWGRKVLERQLPGKRKQGRTKRRYLGVVMEYMHEVLRRDGKLSVYRIVWRPLMIKPKEKESGCCSLLESARLGLPKKERWSIKHDSDNMWLSATCREE